MRKPTKKIIALLLMLAMALSLAACGSTDSGSTAAKDTSAKAEATPAPEFAYKAEFKNLTSDMPDGIAPLVMNDSGIYVATREKVGENIPDGAVPEYEGQYDIYEPRLIFISFDGTQTQLENYVPMKDESGNEGKRDYISSTMPEAAVLDKDGNIVLLERVYTAYSEAPDDIKADDPDYFNYAQSGSVNYIRTLDATGAELSHGIAELSDDDYIGGIALDENGNVVAAPEFAAMVAEPEYYTIDGRTSLYFTDNSWSPYPYYNVETTDEVEGYTRVGFVYNNGEFSTEPTYEAHINYHQSLNNLWIAYESNGSAFVPGDVNGDGQVMTDDALTAMRCALGLINLDASQLRAADMDGDGAVSTADALTILRLAICAR